MALIEIGSIRLLTDPVLDDAGTTYDDGVIPLEKTSAASITPQELGRIDAVLLSHDQHSDNLDNRGREFLAQAPRVLTTPEAAQRLGRGAEGLSPWKETHVTGVDGFTIKVTATPAQHGPDGTQELTGTVTGFLIDWAGVPRRAQSTSPATQFHLVVLWKSSSGPRQSALPCCTWDMSLRAPTQVCSFQCPQGKRWSTLRRYRLRLSSRFISMAGNTSARAAQIH